VFWNSWREKRDFLKFGAASSTAIAHCDYFLYRQMPRETVQAWLLRQVAEPIMAIRTQPLAVAIVTAWRVQRSRHPVAHGRDKG
jgi:hypothetical protein